jgi:hypothetical protein
MTHTAKISETLKSRWPVLKMLVPRVNQAQQVNLPSLQLKESKVY